MRMRWGEAETCIFAKCYVSHACLWNPEHSFYKVKSKRIHAYREIMAQFYDATGIKLNEIEVKLKIKNLRSTYSQEIQKIKQRSNEGWTYKPALKWFKDWYRCLSTINNTSLCVSGIKKVAEDTFDLSGDISSQQDPENQDVWASPIANTNENSEPLTESDDFKLLLLKPEPSDTSSERRDHGRTYKVKKKKVKRQRHTSTDESDKTFGDTFNSSLEPTKEDEFDIYGKYIATQLRKMNLQKALKVQLEIQSLVSEARITDLN